MQTRRPNPTPEQQVVGREQQAPVAVPVLPSGDGHSVSHGLIGHAQVGQGSNGIAGEVEAHSESYRRGPFFDNDAVHTSLVERAGQRQTANTRTNDQDRPTHGHPPAERLTDRDPAAHSDHRRLVASARTVTV